MVKGPGFFPFGKEGKEEEKKGGCEFFFQHKMKAKSSATTTP
jgi:hypothetical protein